MPSPPRRTLALALVGLVALLVGLGALVARSTDDGPPPSATGQRFDGDRAWELIVTQLGYGQRPAGSPQLRALAERLRPLLPDGRFEDVPGEPGLRNIVGTLPGTLPAIVVGAHYDTLVEPEGFVGANNGAAGTAAVIEIARSLAGADRPEGAPEIRFVLFDGEEPAEGRPSDYADFSAVGLRGSKAYVAAHGDEVGEMVLLDYVAGRDLRLPREANSDPDLWADVRAAAAEVGAGGYFPTGTGPAIVDDHVPFLRAGIPAVNLIDWTYPGQTLADGLDLLSRESLDAVGETVVQLLLDRARAS